MRRNQRIRQAEILFSIPAAIWRWYNTQINKLTTRQFWTLTALTAAVMVALGIANLLQALGVI